MRYVLLACLLLTAGCLEDAPADDTDAPDDAMPAPSPEPAPEPAPQVVQITVAWDGAYAGAGTAATGAGYDQSSLTVPANSTVELTFVNNDPAVGHDIAVEGYEDAGADSDTIGSGQSVTITFDVGAPGETAFYCTIPGHRGNGMEGTFIIE